MKWLLPILLIFLFLGYCEAESSSSTDTVLNVSLAWYHIPYVYNEENLVKQENSTIIIRLWRQNTVNLSDREPEPDAIVYGNLTSPDGTVYDVNFTSLGDGNYSLSFKFNKIGLWKLFIRAEKNYSYTETISWIWVGRLPLSTDIISSTEYSSGEEGSIMVLVKDADGNLVPDASCAVRIYYPNRTLFEEGSMNYMDNGIYYYNFTTPNVFGIYSVFVNCTRSNFSSYDASTFHVSAWASNITDLKTLVQNLWEAENCSYSPNTTKCILLYEIREKVENITVNASDERTYEYLTNTIYPSILAIWDMEDCDYKPEVEQCKLLNSINETVFNLKQRIVPQKPSPILPYKYLIPIGAVATYIILLLVYYRSKKGGLFEWA